ncbi:MAG: glycosyltransferase, partial [Anaerolineales bacterium]|nr:glycosyltransferase [Anaerolineales bacterium]
EELTPGQMVSLYQQCDLLIAPSRGEGFGLPLAEAMLFDLPVLTTGYGGQLDFCTHKTAWLIDYKFARAKTHLNLPDSVWVEPDLDDLIRKMEQIPALSPEKISWKTNRAKENILQHYSWAQVAKRLHTAVEGLDRQRCPKPEPRIGWVTTWNTRCGIASYSKYLIEALSVQGIVVLANHSNQSGTDLNLSLDAPYVLRCWETGGKDKLHRLFQTILAQKITDVVIQFNFSFFKLQALSELLMAMNKHNIRCYLFLHSTADVPPPMNPNRCPPSNRLCALPNGSLFILFMILIF